MGWSLSPRGVEAGVRHAVDRNRRNALAFGQTQVQHDLSGARRGGAEIVA